SWVIVSDADGNVLVNTASTPGQALGRRTGEGLASQLRAIQTGKPSVSDVFVGPVSQAWIATVDMPIFKDGRPFRCVTISIPRRNSSP
ncbi:PDC sensor domain-containing protein, partial [Vibrio parahaemolyticus]